MEYHNINNTLNNRKRVTSTYAEIYFDETYCEDKSSKNDCVDLHKTYEEEKELEEDKNEWTSPSDLLIGIIELKPPFTSKITRGKTHEGILAIGNALLETERAKFLNSLKFLLEQNDACWNHILDYEKQEVIKKVKAIFLNIYQRKSDIMKQEISIFYEKSLQDLEKYLKSEIKIILETVQANVISDLNNQIPQRLKKERKILANILYKRYISELKKIKKYYSILLDNELSRYSRLINNSIFERNDALKAFYAQIEAERLTSTMYVMSLERKKCEIKKILLENIQQTEIAEKMEKIKERMKEIEEWEKRDIRITDINKQWEEKIRKILHLFLKFIGFSLKLLPEQSTFLLDLERMVLLQLNKIQKNPNIASTILLEENEQINQFQFFENKQEIILCEKDPFVVVGDLSEPVPPRYGSRETLPSDVDLPYLRLQRQFVYAKCHGYEEIKKFLDSQKCKCDVYHLESTSPEPQPSPPESKPQSVIALEEVESSNESFLIDDFSRLYECPARKCFDWMSRNSFPNLPSYLDYTEEKFNRVTAILGKIPKKKPPPPLISARDIAYSELPFSATKELYHTAETQYSSQEDLNAYEPLCPCVETTLVSHSDSDHKLKVSSSQALNDIMLRRKRSLQRLIEKNPNLHKMFTDELFDYKLQSYQ